MSSAVDNNSVYLRFSPEDDDKRNGEIIPAFKQIILEKKEDGSENTNADVGPLLSHLVIDNKDFNKDKEGEQSYGLELQDASALSCDSVLDDFVSTKMDNTGGLALHEALHVDTISKAVLGFSIVDGINKDGEGAFGPERAFALVYGTPNDSDDGPPGSGENPGLVTANADNYAWHATNAFMAQKECSQGDFKDPQVY
ncbi:hypothetical protein DV736_g3614, partial [Chaetothyriales sp. CBS 134916]